MAYTTADYDNFLDQLQALAVEDSKIPLDHPQRPRVFAHYRIARKTLTAMRDGAITQAEGFAILRKLIDEIPIH
jgi:hypothetical protein